MSSWKKILIAKCRSRLAGVKLAGLVGGAIALASAIYLLPASAQVLVPSSSDSVTLTEEGIQFEGTSLKKRMMNFFSKSFRTNNNKNGKK